MLPPRTPNVRATFAWACLALLTPAAAAPPDDSAWVSHTIVRGDTLIGITQRLLAPGSDWRTLQRLNRVREPRRLPVGTVLRIPAAMLREQPQIAEVLHAHGEVRVERAGRDAAPLAGGDDLAAGDTVITGTQSSATLRFADGSRVLVRPASRLRIERTTRRGASADFETRVRLDDGSADTRVPPRAGNATRRFEMRTPMAQLGVRGTEFRTVAAPQLARLEVLEGAVAMNAAGTADIVTVDAGQGAQAAAQGVAAPRPLPAAPVLDAMPARIERLPLTIGWPAQPGAARYRAQLFDAQGGLVLDGLFEAPLARWTEAVPDGDYALHVRSADDAGLEGRDATAAFVLAARPEPPLVSAPRAGARLSGPQVRFEWTRNPNAAHYRLQLADSTDFAAPLIDRSDLTEPQLVLDVPAGTHYWRLASIRADGHRGPWGDALRFERITLPPAPTSSAPSTSDEGVLLRWSSPAAGAQRSHVQVARDAQFAQLVVDEQTTADTWLLHHPEPGIYYVRIRSIQADGFAGPFGEVQQLDVAPARPLWPALVPIVLFLLL